MGTRYPTTSVPTFDQSWWYWTLVNLSNAINSGAVVSFSHINTIMYMWNVFIGHGHTVADTYGMWDYGDGVNNPGYAGGPNGSQVTAYTTGPYGLAGAISPVGTTGGRVYVSDLNNMLSRLTGGMAHYHTWEDRTG